MAGPIRHVVEMGSLAKATEKRYIRYSRLPWDPIPVRDTGPGCFQQFGPT
jgi:hypothetical protein